MDKSDFILKPNAFKILCFMRSGYDKGLFCAEDYFNQLGMSRGTFFSAIKELENTGYIKNDSSIGYFQIKLVKYQQLKI